MSSYQKQNLLDQLHQYLNSNDAMKQVMNSPGCDRRGGKILSGDGTKALYSNQNGFKNGFRKNDWKKRGQNGKGKNGKSNEGNNKSTKSNQQVLNLSIRLISV